MRIIVVLLMLVAPAFIAGCGGGGSSASSSSSSSSGSGGSSENSPVYPDYNTSPLAPDMTGMSSTAVEIAAHIALGWNIGNSLEATGGETGWGNPVVTGELIRLVKASGFDAVRIPVSWDQHADQTTAAIDVNWLGRVKQVVQYCVDNDLYTIVNIHWDGGWLERNVTPDRRAENVAKQKAYWQQIATHLRSFDEHLMFASANEPNVTTAEQMDVLLSYHQAFIDAVRSTGGKNAYRVLVVQGPNTDIEMTNNLWSQMPSDTLQNRLMAEIHFYTPWNFAGLTADQSWGNQFFYWGSGNHSSTDTAHNPTWGEEADVDNLFALMKNKFVNNGIPVVLGEYSATRRNGQLAGDDLLLHLASRAYWHQYVTSHAIANGLLPFYWDNGGLGNHASGIFDRNNNTIFDQQTLDALKLGAGK